MKKILCGITVFALSLVISAENIAYAINDMAKSVYEYSVQDWRETCSDKLAGVTFLNNIYNQEELDLIRDVTLDIVGSETDMLEQLKLLRSWFIKYNNYDGNYDAHKAQLIEIFATYGESIIGRWVCKEQSNIFTEMCRILGIKTIMMNGICYQDDLRENPDVDSALHAWNVVYIDGEWKIFDASWLGGGKDDIYYLGDVEDSFFERKYMGLTQDNTFSMSYTCSDYAADGIYMANSQYLIPPDATRETKNSSFATEISRGLFADYVVQLYTQATGKSRADFISEFCHNFTDFSDVNETIYPEIGIDSALGIVSGVGDNKFSPKANITRQEAATMLMRLGKLLGLEMTGSEVHFSDVDDSFWAKEGIDYVSSVGIMAGVGDGKFDPNGLYTHEQTILTMVRLFNMV